MLGNLCEGAVWIAVGLLRLTARQFGALLDLLKNLEQKGEEKAKKEKRIDIEVPMEVLKAPASAPVITVEKPVPDLETFIPSQSTPNTTELFYELVKKHHPDGISIAEAARELDKKPQALSRIAGYLVNSSKINKEDGRYYLA